MIRKEISVLVLTLFWYFEDVKGLGKYKYVMLSMGSCTGPEYADIESPFRNLVFKKINRTAKTLSFDVTWNRPWDDKLGTSIKATKININGGNRDVIFLPVLTDPCKLFLRYYRQNWIDFLTHLGVRQPDKCPIPAGNYTMNKYVFNGEYGGVTTFPMVGRFLMRTNIVDLKTKKIISCVENISDLSEV